MTSQAAIADWAVHVPGIDLTHYGIAGAEAVRPERAHELLGRKGLLYLDDTTRLALCAVHQLLGLPAGKRPPATAPDPDVGVVVSSTLGNVGRVHDIVTTLRADGHKAVSPLDAPNASSNVVASSIAVRFRLGGPNLMICSGAQGGLLAVELGMLLLASGRARRVVVVGAESDSSIARLLHARRKRSEGRFPLRSGAAALLLAEVSQAPQSAPVIEMLPNTDPQEIAAMSLDSLLSPYRHPGMPRGVDLRTEVGDLYGGMGVLQSAVAVAMLNSEGRREGERVLRSIGIVCGDEHEGWCGAHVVRARR